ncbi:MAG: hypothetical protein NC218_02515 [Acetobacter sp.]|nr:hypothetical protein [Acetobacter sp.]
MKIQRKAPAAPAVESNNFYSFLDALTTGKTQTVAPKAPAKEELDSNSSQDEFIEAIAQAAADFISSNRNAFNLDDNEAVKEFADVFTVEEVRNRVVTYLQQPEEEEQQAAEPTEDAADTGDETQQPDEQEENPDLVSADVMALLDE